MLTVGTPDPKVLSFEQLLVRIDRAIYASQLEPIKRYFELIDIEALTKLTRLSGEPLALGDAIISLFVRSFSNAVDAMSAGHPKRADALELRGEIQNAQRAAVRGDIERTDDFINSVKALAAKLFAET